MFSKAGISYMCASAKEMDMLPRGILLITTYIFVIKPQYFCYW